MLALDDRWMAYRFGETHHGEERKLFFAAHRSGRGIDGYAVYQVKHDWHIERRNELAVEDVQALTAQAYAELWRYLFDVDLMDRITAWNRPSDEPLLHRLQEPDRLRLRLGDGLWVRLVDLPAALRARRYAVPGSIAFRVEDGFCPWNEGTYRLEGGPDGAECRPTGAEPELALSAAELGACYLGGMGFRALARAGRVRELRPGALERADAMFAWDPAPWCSFMF
jgi:predicted acetyltransferase